MEHIELRLDEDTVRRAKRLAEARRCTIEQLIADLLKQVECSEPTRDPYLGMFADEPELMDYVVGSAMQARSVIFQKSATLPMLFAGEAYLPVKDLKPKRRSIRYVPRGEEYVKNPKLRRYDRP